jgi:tetratricopeptide (TPR) repeat protein
VPLFGRVRVVVYLRRQDEAAVSRYSTALRAGAEAAPEVLPRPGEEARQFDLAAMMDRYAAVFGTGAMLPRVFERESQLGGDVVRDFLHLCGLEGLAPAEAAPRGRNLALRAEVQDVLRRFNARVEHLGMADRPRVDLSLRREGFQGRGRLPSRAEAVAFLDRFREGNERIRATWFPERPSLFSEDFDRYPEHEDRTALADSRLLETAIDMMIAVAADLRSAQARALLDRGRKAEEAGRIEEARRHHSKVLREDKDHKRARNALRRLDNLELGKAPRRRLERRSPDAVRPAGRPRR